MYARTYAIPDTAMYLDHAWKDGSFDILWDRSATMQAENAKKNLRKIFFWSGAALLVQAGVFWVMYEAEYADIVSVRKYQQVGDVAHNRSTIAVNRCLLKAGSNYLDNWNRLCTAYGLEEGCGLPKEKYDLLTAGLNKDNEACRVATPGAK